MIQLPGLPYPPAPAPAPISRQVMRAIMRREIAAQESRARAAASKRSRPTARAAQAEEPVCTPAYFRARAKAAREWFAALPRYDAEAEQRARDAANFHARLRMERDSDDDARVAEIAERLTPAKRASLAALCEGNSEHWRRAVDMGASPLALTLLRNDALAERELGPGSYVGYRPTKLGRAVNAHAAKRKLAKVATKRSPAPAR